MARFNKIYAGPVEAVLPQVQEAVKTTTTLPGTAMKFSGSNFVAAGAADNAKLFLAQDNYLLLKGVDDVWAANERVIGMELLPDRFYHVRVPTGQNIAKGDALTTDANAKFVKAATGNRIVFFAEEAYNNTSGADQLVRARSPGLECPAGSGARAELRHRFASGTRQPARNT